MPRTVRVFSIFATASLLAGHSAQAQSGATTVMNRMMCPLTAPGCFLARVDYQALAGGGSQWDLFLRVLQVPQYPTDPSWLTVSTFLFQAPTNSNVPLSSPEPSVYTYGNLQNTQGARANTWTTYAAPGALAFQANFSNPYAVNALSGCTPAAQGRSGYGTCVANDPTAALRFSISLPYTIDWNTITYANFFGESENGTWACDVMSTGRTTSPTLTNPRNPNVGVCDVSESLDPLNVGTMTAVVTPEPASFLLLATGLVGIAGAVRQRRRIR